MIEILIAPEIVTSLPVILCVEDIALRFSGSCIGALYRGNDLKERLD